MSNVESETVYTDTLRLSIGKPRLVISEEDLKLVKEVREFLENNNFDHSLWPDEDIVHILREKANPRMTVMSAAAYIMDADEVPDQWVTVKSRKNTKSKAKKTAQQENQKSNQNNVQRKTNRGNFNDKNLANKNAKRQPNQRKVNTKNNVRPNANKASTTPKPSVEKKPVLEKKPKKEFKGWDTQSSTIEKNDQLQTEHNKQEEVIKTETSQSHHKQFEEKEVVSENYPSQNTKLQTGTKKVVMPSYDLATEDIYVQFGGPISKDTSSKKPEVSFTQPQPQSQPQTLHNEETPKHSDLPNEKVTPTPPPGAFSHHQPYMTSQHTYNQIPFIPATQGYMGYPFDDSRMNFYSYESFNQIPTYPIPPSSMNSNVNSGGEPSQTSRTQNPQEKNQTTGKASNYFSNGGNPTHFPYYPYPYLVPPQNTSYQHPHQYNVQGQSTQYMRANYGKQRNQQYNEELTQ